MYSHQVPHLSHRINSTDHYRSSPKRNGRQEEHNKLGRAMRQALKLLQMANWDKVTLNSEEIKPVALVIIKLCLSGGISS